MDIGVLLPRHARYRPDHLAVVVDDQRLTQRAFNQRVNRLANALLNLGISKGDSVAVILPNCLELLEVYWACARIGAVVVPLSPLLRGSGLLNLLRDADSVVVITNVDFQPILEPLRADLSITSNRYILTDGPDMPGYASYVTLTQQASLNEPARPAIHPDDSYNIIYSSGTTGQPKGIVHTHAIRTMYCTLFASAYRITPESVVLHAGSIIFNGAFLTLMPAFYLGATYILQHHFDPEAVIATIRRERVTHIKLVPSQIIALLNSPNFTSENLASLQMVGSVGAPLHLEYKKRLEQILPTRLYELYGLTEGFVTILDKYDVAAKTNSVGVPPPFFELRIVDENHQDVGSGVVGEIIGRGPLLTPGYYKRPDLTAQAIIDGWLYTGDLGYLDDDGFLYLVDRKKDLIISGGVNVYPHDIEDVVVQHPAVREVAVFGVPHERWGEVPIAAVILHEANGVAADTLRDWINERVEARYQKVHRVVLMDDFPRSTAGKTLKRTMREPYLNKAAHPEGA